MSKRNYFMQNGWIHSIVVCLLIFSFHSTVSSAEDIDIDKNKTICGWLDTGMGWSTDDLYPGVALHFLYDHHLFTLYGDYSNEVEIIFSDNVDEWIMDIGITYGYCRKRRITGLSASVGLSFIHGLRPGDYIGSEEGWFGTNYYEKIYYTTIGIPISLRAFITPTPFFGFGINGHANINAAHSLVGAQLFLMFGKLR